MKVYVVAYADYSYDVHLDSVYKDRERAEARVAAVDAEHRGWFEELDLL